MSLPIFRVIAIALWGAASIWLWTWLVGDLTLAVYRALGSPPRTPATWWTTILAPAFALGLSAGAPIGVLGRDFTGMAMVIYWASLLATTEIAGVFTDRPEAALVLVTGSTSWAYFAGSCLIPAAVVYHARRVRRSEP